MAGVRCIVAFTFFPFFLGRRWGELFITFVFRKSNSIHSAQFGDQFFSLCLFQLGDVSHRLWTRDVASPGMTDVIVSIIVIRPDGFHWLSRSSSVFPVNLCEGNSSAGLPAGLARPSPTLSPSQDTGQEGRQPAQWGPPQVQSLLAELSCFPPRWGRQY